MNSLCGLSRTGSSSAAAGDPERPFAVADASAAAGLAAAERLKGEPAVPAAGVISKIHKQHILMRKHRSSRDMQRGSMLKYMAAAAAGLVAAERL
jgi:hypothetical protein